MYRYECTCGEAVSFAHDPQDAPVCFCCGGLMRHRVVAEPVAFASESDLTPEQLALARLMRQKPGHT